MRVGTDGRKRRRVAIAVTDRWGSCPSGAGAKTAVVGQRGEGGVSREGGHM